MNEIPRQKLCEIITLYGYAICDEPQRCEGILRDFCGQYRKEIFILVTALKNGVATELLKSQNTVPKEVILARLIKRLHDDLGIAEEAAEWTVKSWALALGVSYQLQKSGEEPKFNPQDLPKKEEYESKLRQYEQDFLTAVKSEYPLSVQGRNKLRNFHEFLGIKLVDVEQIEKPIVLEKEASYWKQSAAKQQEKLQELEEELETQTKQQEGIKQKAEKFRSGLIAISLLSVLIGTGLGVFSYHQNQEIEQSKIQISEVNQKNNEIESKLERLETAIEKEFEGQFGQGLLGVIGRQFWLKNQCYKPIKIALRYKQTSGEWKTNGWWNFDPYDNSYLASGGERIRLNSPLFYYYAELQQGGSDSWSGEESVYFDGRTLPMRIGIAFPDSDGDYTLSLTCPNL
jgi:hypothetical protein